MFGLLWKKKSTEELLQHESEILAGMLAEKRRLDLFIESTTRILYHYVDKSLTLEKKIAEKELRVDYLRSKLEQEKASQSS